MHAACASLLNTTRTTLSFASQSELGRSMFGRFAGTQITRATAREPFAISCCCTLRQHSGPAPVQARAPQLSEAVNTAPRRASSTDLASEIGRSGEPRACKLCGGSGHLPCRACGGAGRLALGGHHKNNQVNVSRLVGSKWTARQRTFGRTHFFVSKLHVSKPTKSTYALMVAACGTSNETQFWLNAKTLKSRELWSSGWLQRSQRLELAEGGPPCKCCGGSGATLCQLCDARGTVVEV